MRGFVTLTHHGTDRKFTLPVSAITTLQPAELDGIPCTKLLLSFTKTTHVVSESHEEVCQLVAEAQA